MLTGTAALRDIDRSLQTIRNDVVRLDKQLAQMTTRLGEAQRHRLKLINDIAEIRLAGIERGELQKNLGAADHEVGRILEQRNAALTELNTGIDKLNRQIADADMAREEHLQKVNDTSQKVLDGESLVQQQLNDDKTYLAQLEKAGRAEAMALEAEQKAQQAQADLAKKAEPYQRDKLFMYLWNRGFGTTEYDGRLFSRFMDSWVAGLINYAPARVNFWNLTEIPKRLAEHADRIEAMADAQHKALQKLEKEALEAAGVTSIEDQLVKLREDLDRLDDSIEELENTLNSRLSERTRFLAGEDDYMQRCIARLSQALEHQDVQALQRYVRATRSEADDAILFELERVMEKLQDMTGDLAEIRILHGNKIKKLAELEKVRRNFKNSRFDDVRSGFGEKSVLAGLMTEFLQGFINGSDLWRTIQRHQRHRDVGSAPDFGSGSLGNIGDILGGVIKGSRRGRKTRGSSWHIPRPRGGGGGFKRPRGGSRGGFKTGGGF